jgi:hypothetical protein
MSKTRAGFCHVGSIFVRINHLTAFGLGSSCFVPFAGGFHYHHLMITTPLNAGPNTDDLATAGVHGLADSRPIGLDPVRPDSNQSVRFKRRDTEHVAVGLVSRFNTSRREN